MKTKVEFRKMTDEELVDEIVKNKNVMLFEVLYDRYCDIIYNKCYSFSKSADEANDLTQDVFLKLFIKLGSFKGNSKFSTWLYSFTYNFCANYVTRSTAKKIEKKSIPIEEYDHLLIEVDDYSLFQIQVDKLKKALDLLSDEDRMILLLKYQDDLSIKELSTVLEIGESAVKMRLKRAKARVVVLCNEKL